jgi:glycosyltransferase involved in cell wall biosynthesis
MATVQIQPELSAGQWRDCAAREVTIIIPTFRNMRYLPAAFESALHAPAAAVIVADDGCGPAEREVIARFEEEHGPRLRTLASESQRGIAANLNEAIARVRTPYFARLDCDDVLYPGHLETAYRLLVEQPDVAAVAGSAIRIGAEEHLGFRAESLPAYRPDPCPRILRGVEAFRFALEWSPNPSSSGSVYRTAAFHDVGAFNPRVLWGEDWEIWFRFAQRWDIAYMDAPSALYRIHSRATTAEFSAEDRLCFAYHDIYSRAARLCPYPDLKPQLRRAFLRVARLYAGAAYRRARRLRWDSLLCAGRAAQALRTAAVGS